MNNTRIYGRAQRIEFFKKVAIFVCSVLLIMVVASFIMNHKEKVDENVDFAFLREYMEANGYSCELIHKANGRCILRGENSTSSFYRYEDGFEFIIKSDAYILNIRHASDKEDYITFKTTNGAIAGYKNLSYTCRTKGNVLDSFEKCIDANGDELSVNAYKGVVERAIKDLNNFIDSSGYDKDRLMKEYAWIKK